MDSATKALEYHALPEPGKVKVVPSKRMVDASDLSLGYTPGVAEPCLAIQGDAGLAYKYTSKGNLVAVISNGTAVLGLGDIGALAGKPVMEGKGNLFKRFADIDVFDLEIDETDIDKFVEIVAKLEPTFGGINLEDIKSPECFAIEKMLTERMSIPVFHDDQHGTAVIVAAGLLNALKIAGKKAGEVKVVFLGAGAAAIACAKMLLEIGVRKKNIFMFDSVGLLTKKRLAELNEYKAEFVQDRDRSLSLALDGADVLIGVSKAKIVSGEMLDAMAEKPIVFAMANPVPEILPDEAKSARSDVIVATGRSDYPNQVNNVLCFPFIFRGALDVRASRINQEMKLAAVKAIAELAREPLSEETVKIYGQGFSFGPEYILPKPFDERLLPRVSSAVAKAAMLSGVARQPIDDLDEYFKKLTLLSKRLAVGEFL